MRNNTFTRTWTWRQDKLKWATTAGAREINIFVKHQTRCRRWHANWFFSSNVPFSCLRPRRTTYKITKDPADLEWLATVILTQLERKIRKCKTYFIKCWTQGHVLHSSIEQPKPCITFNIQTWIFSYDVQSFIVERSFSVCLQIQWVHWDFKEIFRQQSFCSIYFLCISLFQKVSQRKKRA